MRTQSDFTNPQYPRAVVLCAVRIAEGTLERWLERGQIRDIAQIPGTGHRRLFSKLDVATLAAVVDLGRHDVPVSGATYLLYEAIGQKWPEVAAGSEPHIFCCVERYKGETRCELYTHAAQVPIFLTEPSQGTVQTEGEQLEAPERTGDDTASRVVFDVGPAVRAALAQLP
jgi:hypothetical protein